MCIRRHQGSMKYPSGMRSLRYVLFGLFWLAKSHTTKEFKPPRLSVLKLPLQCVLMCTWWYELLRHWVSTKCDSCICMKCYNFTLYFGYIIILFFIRVNKFFFKCTRFEDWIGGKTRSNFIGSVDRRLLFTNKIYVLGIFHRNFISNYLLILQF